MDTYQNVIIYQFSGTGNALTGAKWIKKYTDKKNIKTEIFAIENIQQIQLPETTGKTLIGFCYPTHGFAPSWIVIKFMLRFPKIKNADVFFLNTRGAFKIYKLMIPGLSGLALWFPVLLFLLKRYSIKGILPLDMPINWTSFFPPVNKAAVNSLVSRSHRIVEKFCEHIFNDKKYFRYSIWISSILDISVSPISFLYIFWGRFFLAKTLYASYTCDSCRICEANCPVHAIKIKNSRPYWKYTCESCMRCMNICPANSIQSWVSRIFIFGYLLMIFIVSYLGYSKNVWHILFIILFFPFYRLLYLLLSNKFINILFTYTSLTKLWNRYFVPNLKFKDLKKPNKIGR